ncbi:MAG: response regulator [Reichenbachiella sp.]
MDKKVLIVDDSLYMRVLIRLILEGNGFEVVGEASDGVTSIELAKDLHPDLILLDNVLPDMLGVDVLDSFIEEGEGQNVIMISSMNTDSNLINAKKRGVLDYIVKPFKAEELLFKAKKALGE